MHVTIPGTEISVAWVCAMKKCTWGSNMWGELPGTLVLSLGELVESCSQRGELSSLGWQQACSRPLSKCQPP